MITQTYHHSQQLAVLGQIRIFTLLVRLLHSVAFKFISMSGFDENIVREYFELNGFFVRQLRKYAVQSRKKRSDEEIDLVVYNPHPKTVEGTPGFQLFSKDIARIQRAVVVVKGWHTSRFTPSMLKNGRRIFDFLKTDVIQQTGDLFDFTIDDRNDEQDTEIDNLPDIMKILILPSLPASDPHRSESINMLRDRGVDGILTFGTILENLIRRVEVNRSYQKSELLQLMRILKIYDLVKDPQMQLFN
jgi:hypothetical protein